MSFDSYPGYRTVTGTVFPWPKIKDMSLILRIVIMLIDRQDLEKTQKWSNVG